MKTISNARCKMHNWLRGIVAITALMLFGMTTAYAQQPQTGDVIYVYQKDGRIDAFLRSEIEEFYYSFEDEDGVTQNEPQMQCIALEDSICKIPLTNIDSVSFVTPATVLQPGVTDLKPTLSQYAVDSKEQTLFLAASTPGALLPAVGQRVVLAERGIAGDVVSVSQEEGLYVVRTNGVAPEHIYVTHYAVNITDFELDGTATAKSVNTSKGAELKKTIKLSPLTLSLNEEMLDIFLPNDTMPDAVKFNYTTTVQPTFTVKASLIVNNGTQASVSVVGDFDSNTLFKFNGKAEFSHDIHDKMKDFIEWPLGETLLFFYNRWGLVFKAAVELDVSMQWKQLYRATFEWNYNSKAEQQEMPRASFKRVSAEYEPEGTLKGSIAFGPFTEVGIKFITTDLAKVCLRAEGPIELAGTFVLNNKTVEEACGETKLYEALKDSKIELNATGSTSIQLSYLTTEQGFDLPWNGSYNLKTWYLVPEFKNTLLAQKYGAPTTAIGSVGMTKRNLIVPVEIGLRLFDKDGLPVDDWKSDNKYSSGTRTIEHQFNGLDSEAQYTLRPTVKLLFWDMVATPDAPIMRDPFPVRIVSFEQTGSGYSDQQGYEFDGRNYYFKFNATTTVELSDKAQNVEDWGYIYHDIYGEDKRISCAGLGGNTYADERWAYYYNESKRSVELFPYVKYYNDNSYYYGRHDEWWVDHEFPFPVSIVNFKQVSQAYDMGRYFSYEGKRYYYKFGAVTTVELSKDVANVEDWGYIYHDIYGVDKMISCANLGSNPYDDARYAYYYNDSERTVDLRPYVKYYGDDEYHVGPSETLALEWKSCPDNNHPHAIDLGWPSGTKWSCCNLGAITPEGRGDPYAWGETVTKDVFKFENYSLIEQVENTPWWRCIDIGRDIAGTEYDAARAQWGGSWQMPSKSDWDELDGKNVQTWVVHNGVPGRKYIGYNGNTIFIPATDRGEFYPGQPPVSFGYYWSSTCRDNKVELSGTSCSHYFYEGGMGNYGTSDNARERGLWIRPVIK